MTFLFRFLLYRKTTSDKNEKNDANVQKDKSTSSKPIINSLTEPASDIAPHSQEEQALGGAHSHWYVDVGELQL